MRSLARLAVERGGRAARMEVVSRVGECCPCGASICVAAPSGEWLRTRAGRRPHGHSGCALEETRRRAPQLPHIDAAIAVM